MKISKKRALTLIFASIMATTTLAGCTPEGGKKPEEQAPIIEEEDVNEEVDENTEDVNEEVDETAPEVADVDFTIEDQLKKPEAGDKIAKIETSEGDVLIKLLPEIAPKAVENFEKLSAEGYYDDQIFHRVIEDFMIQGGDPKGDGTGGQSIWGEPFVDEFHAGARNFRGALSMANGGPKTNGSQFFIVQGKDIAEEVIANMEELGEAKGYSEEVQEKYKEIGGTPFLDFKHTVFGQVYEGMDIVDKIAATETDDKDKPTKDIVVKTITVEEFK